MCMRVCVSQNSNGILKVIWIYAFTECLWACNLVWVKISFDLNFKSVANIRAFDSVNWGESMSNSFQDQYYPWDVHVTATS